MALVDPDILAELHDSDCDDDDQLCKTEENVKAVIKRRALAKEEAEYEAFMRIMFPLLSPFIVTANEYRPKWSENKQQDSRNVYVMTMKSF